MSKDSVKNSPNIYFKFVFSFIIVSIFYALALTAKGTNDSYLVYLTNYIIILYSLIHILSHENRSYSAQKIFYLFIFFFMGIAPLMQYKFNIETVGGYKINEDTYIYTNIIIIISLIIFDLSYYLTYNSHSRKKTLGVNTLILGESAKWRNVLLILSSISVIYTIYTFRQTPLLLVIRGFENITNDIKPSSGNFSGPLFDCIIRPLSAICCINYLALGKNNKYKIIFLLLTIIGCFPTSLARLRTAAYYMPIVIILFPKLRFRNRFTMLFVSSFLLVFPLLNNFRTWSTGKFSIPRIDFNMFCNMNYDSYQSFAFVMQNDVVTYGKQLSVALFFWVPRSFWPDKPYMSGKMIAHEYNLWFDQISMNYFGEGYLNGGVFGVVIFTIFLAYITAKFDYIYWIKNHGNVHTLIAPFFLLFIGMYFFFMRGDLMYGLEYTLCLLFTNYIIYKISTKLLK